MRPSYDLNLTNVICWILLQRIWLSTGVCSMCILQELCTCMTPRLGNVDNIASPQEHPASATLTLGAILQLTEPNGQAVPRVMRGEELVVHLSVNLAACRTGVRPLLCVNDRLQKQCSDKSDRDLAGKRFRTPVAQVC